MISRLGIFVKDIIVIHREGNGKGDFKIKSLAKVHKEQNLTTGSVSSVGFRHEGGSATFRCNLDAKNKVPPLFMLRVTPEVDLVD